MRRRRRGDEHSNQERWLVSYADFITLLFAFFVVMYSVSSVNEGKYKVLSNTLVEAFSQVDRAFQPIPIGDEPARSIQGDHQGDHSLPSTGQTGASKPASASLQQVTEDIRQAFGELIGSHQLKVRGNEQWVEIELDSSLLFPSGDALPNDTAFGVIEKIAAILAPYENPILVEGFTDDRPISTPQYPSNWELSAARAASIVRLLAMHGINPARMAAVGYGEFQPVADNATAESRSRNRRVVLVVSRNPDVRRAVNEVGAARVAQPDATLQRTGTQPASGSPIQPPAGAADHSSAADPPGHSGSP